QSINLTADTNWQATFDKLMKYDPTDGHEITYAIEEVAISGYTTTITGDVQNGFVVTNTQEVPPIPTIKYRDIQVQKHWIGEPTDSVTIKLLANGKATDKEITLNATTNWQGKFTELPITDDKGNEITYIVEEVTIPGYTTNITGNIEKGFIVTNTQKPEKPMEPEPNLESKKTVKNNLPTTGTKALTVSLVSATSLLLIAMSLVIKVKK
ncbi:hypothetical protein SAMN05421767_1821, partial [Granulicatella balaenopterae]